MSREPDWQLNGHAIYAGDCLESLRGLDAGSVRCCVTSPPYWGLRDYGTAEWEGGDAECDHIAPPRGSTIIKGSAANKTGPNQTEQFGEQYRDTCGKCGATRIDAQLGLEPTPDEYVANMVAVFREVRRVLADDGTLWLNLGDSYNGSGSVGGNGKQHTNQGSVDRPDNRAGWSGLKPKDLVGIPWRVAFALQADGWYLRQDIIWHKPNPMPESVTDRCTKGHEYIFLLSKSPRYYYDAVAIAEEAAYAGQMRGGSTNRYEQNAAGMDCKVYDTRNKRSVWTVALQPYPEAHFATYPPKLIEPCILAGSSERGKCPECGAAWVREVERTAMVLDRSERTHSKGRTRTSGTMVEPPTSKTIGWSPTCTCNREGWYRCDECDITAHITSLTSGCPTCGETMTPAPFDPIPDTVLDPFTGSGTTGAVAAKWGRRFVGCELNPEYIQLAAKRIGVEADHLFAVGSAE